jgi:hypothetical protein
LKLEYPPQIVVGKSCSASWLKRMGKTSFACPATISWIGQPRNARHKRPMESMRGVTTARIKGRGRRWDIDNAQAMMSLEALYQSTGLWYRYRQTPFARRNKLPRKSGHALSYPAPQSACR